MNERTSNQQLLRTDASDLHVGDLWGYIHSRRPNVLAFERDNPSDEVYDLTLVEAKAMRDYLNRVLPPDETTELHFTIPHKHAGALAMCITATEGSSPNESEATPYLTKIMQACEAAETGLPKEPVVHKCNPNDCWRNPDGYCDLCDGP